MESTNPILHLLTGPDASLVWSIFLLGSILGILITWAIWHNKVNGLRKEIDKASGLATQFETQAKAAEEEIALKESDLKKSALENIKLRQDMKRTSDEYAITKSELQVLREHSEKSKSETDAYHQQIESLENQVLGLKAKNNALTDEATKAENSNTNVEVYTLKTKLTKLNSELATALVDVKRLEGENEDLKKEIGVLNDRVKTSGEVLGQSTNDEETIEEIKLIPIIRKPKVVETEAPESTEKKEEPKLAVKKPLKKSTAKKPAAKKKTTSKKQPTVKKTVRDDLKKVEGIGPKIEQLLNAAGILNWKSLAKTKPQDLRNILADAGNRYKMHDPTTWPEQSALAAKGEWDKLKTFQDFLKGGKNPSA